MLPALCHVSDRAHRFGMFIERATVFLITIPSGKRWCDQLLVPRVRQCMDGIVPSLTNCSGEAISSIKKRRHW